MDPKALPEQVEIVIVGAGLAGAAAGQALVRRGHGSVLVLEIEAVAGVHASGRNAALAYSFIAEPAVRTLARRGRAFLAEPPGDFLGTLENRWQGSVTLVEAAREAEFEPLVADMRAESITLERWDASQISATLPVLGDPDGDVGWFCPSDGVIDVDGLLQGYLRTARRGGAQVRFRTRADALLVEGGRVTGLQTTAGLVRAERVILAGGPWANDLAEGAGLAPLPLAPHRRHLAVVAGEGLWPDPAWPFAWHQTKDFYFRPESGGLLFCACDGDPMEPADVGTDQVRVAELAGRALEMLPGAAAAHIRNAWAGLRTLTPDQQFVIGPDPRLAGLFWAAGLGGHGMTTSPAVGELVADLVDTGRADWVDTAALAPDRFLAGI